MRIGGRRGRGIELMDKPIYEMFNWWIEEHTEPGFGAYDRLMGNIHGRFHFHNGEPVLPFESTHTSPIIHYFTEGINHFVETVNSIYYLGNPRDDSDLEAIKQPLFLFAEDTGCDVVDHRCVNHKEHEGDYYALIDKDILRDDNPAGR